MKLELELIPERQWHLSLAYLLPRHVWDSLRREVYGKFNYTCCICGATNCRVNCHESWTFDDKKRIQHLRCLQCLCDDCHMVKHWGRTVSEVHKGTLPQDTLPRLTQHFCTVNQCAVGDFEAHKVRVGELWLERSRHDYRVDFGLFVPERVIVEYNKREKYARRSRR